MSTLLPDLELRDRDLCFIDTETTGSRLGYHEIIEIAALRSTADGLELKGQWVCRILPEHPDRITSVAQQLNGFSLEAWQGASHGSHSVWESFATFASGCMPICHNPSFDRGFIELAAAQQGVYELNMDYHWIGTESLSWPIYHAGAIPKLSLAEVCRYFAVPSEPAVHGALSGATACREVYLRLIELYDQHWRTPAHAPRRRISHG